MLQRNSNLEVFFLRNTRYFFASVKITNTCFYCHKVNPYYRVVNVMIIDLEFVLYVMTLTLSGTVQCLCSTPECQSRHDILCNTDSLCYVQYTPPGPSVDPDTPTVSQQTKKYVSL